MKNKEINNSIIIYYIDVKLGSQELLGSFMIYFDVNKSGFIGGRPPDFQLSI